MGEFGFGQSVRRKEDLRLLTGHGRFIDDRRLAGECHAVLLRSPHAHAHLGKIDAAAAAASPGVLAVLTGADLAADGIGGVPCDFALPIYPPGPGGPPPIIRPSFPALALDRVRFVGEGVALILAETVAAAHEAAERVAIEYDPIPSVTDPAAATAPGSPLIHAEAARNIAFTWEAGDRAATEAAFAAAHHVTTLDLVNGRVIMAAMETRGALGEYDGRAARFVLHTASQMPHGLRQQLALAFGCTEDRIRVLVGDVGGGFGLKNALYPEYILVLWAARRIGRPVRWIADRSESFLADYHGRDNRTRAALALDESGRFLGLRVATLGNMGAYLAPRGPLSPTSNVPAVSGLYRTPAIHVEVTGVFTNTVPTDVYRGAGRPEAIYMLERLVDAAALEMGLDRMALRRRNMVMAAEMPFRTPLGLVYDSGDFGKVLDGALTLAAWDGFAARKAAAAKRGRLRGIGMAHYVERVAGGWSETAELSIDANGKARVLIATMSNGQGHETAYAQMVADRLGMHPDEVEIVQGDTDRIAPGHGTGGSASLPIAGAALDAAATKIIARAHRIAAHLLETAEADIEFTDGAFIVAGTDRRVSLTEVARAAQDRTGLPPQMSAGLADSGFFKPPGPTWPNGCHICEVEIDPETGALAIEAYTIVHDFGRVLNPLLLEGQLHGGVTQGLGQGGFERVVFDPETGQPLAAS
ncbi:MAG: xanthine dehydrogenase family protein, partial [Alphaproteobacteria bacterium]|nr:xanthine dehydrogenase family protein [Alphaproteobacteria bacterium]